MLPHHGPGYPSDWKEKLINVDPLWDKHPLPPKVRRTYLYSEAVQPKYMMQLVNDCFSKTSAPIKMR